MNPDLFLEVPDTPDRISKSIEIIPKRINNNHRSRRPNLTIKPRNPQSHPLNSNPSTPPNNKRKSPIDISSSNSERNKKGKMVMQEQTRAGPTVRDNKGKGKSLDVQEISPVQVQSGINLTPRRIGKRFLVRNGRIAPCNTANINANKDRVTGGSSNGATGEDNAAKTAGEAGGTGPQPRNRRENNTGISEIVAGDLYEGLISNRSSATSLGNNTNTNGWRTIANHRSETSNQNAPGGSSRPNNPVTTTTTASNPVRTQPPAVSSTSTNNRRENKSVRGRDKASVTLTGESSRPGQNPTRSTGESSRPGQNPTRVLGQSSRSGPNPTRLTGENSRLGSNPTRNQVTDLTTPTRGRVVGVIDVDAITTPRSSDSGIVRARQVAHDEWLARQLQDEFNNEAPQLSEFPLLSMEEMDARIAMEMQEEENNARRGRRGSRVAGSPAAFGVAGGTGRGRGRGRARTRSGQRLVGPAPHFVTAASFAAAHMLGDLDTDDYEVLLALDENNHMHTGASRFQINNLPESVVQSDNFEETCTVCLEKPAVGETIRILPCLHKFHKDCIDEWLQRKKECPVCKFSIG